METPLTEDMQHFMRWLEEGDVRGHEGGESFEVPPHWHARRREIEKLGDLLRLHVPASIEPPDPAAFNEQVRSRLD